MFEKSWQIKTHGTLTRVRPSCLEAGMGKHSRRNMTESGLFKHPLRPLSTSLQHALFSTVSHRLETFQTSSKEVGLKVEFTGKGKGAGPQGTMVSGRGRDAMTMVSGWDATTTLKRSDFGLTWNRMIEGTRAVGDDVQIDLHVEADQQ